MISAERKPLVIRSYSGAYALRDAVIPSTNGEDLITEPERYVELGLSVPHAVVQARYARMVLDRMRRRLGDLEDPDRGARERGR